MRTEMIKKINRLKQHAGSKKGNTLDRKNGTRWIKKTEYVGSKKRNTLDQKKRNMLDRKNGMSCAKAWSLIPPHWSHHMHERGFWIVQV